MEWMDEIRRVALDLASCEKASTVEELIACLDQNPDAAALANAPNIVSSPPPIRLVGGNIMGPCEGECVAPGEEMTQQWFVNVYVRDLARVRHIDLLAPAGAYYRWTNDPMEPTQALARRLAPSFNSRANRWERGLSVAEGPWLYGLNCSWCYFLSGYEVGRGSDDEPVLDVNTLGPASEIMGRKQVFERFYNRNKERLSSICSETGVEVVDLYALFIGISPLRSPVGSF
jgi:hypothetical protein